jgi:hypothetical protein
MKTTILSQDGNMQLVLTPETEFEKSVIEKYGKDFSKIDKFKGSFQDCQGGWTRLYPYEDSLILRINENKSE